MKNIFLTIVTSALVSIGVFGVYHGINKTEFAECVKWQDQSQKYPGYYITEWQKQQCDHQGVDIDAPVR